MLCNAGLETHGPKPLHGAQHTRLQIPAPVQSLAGQGGLGSQNLPPDQVAV